MCLGALAVAVYLRLRYRAYEVTGESMLPTFRHGDYLLVDTWAFRHHSPKRGDAVIARHPRDETMEVVKRVRRVDLHRDVWLEGDNLDASTDSRHFGPVRREAIAGRVAGRYWPIRRS